MGYTNWFRLRSGDTDGTYQMWTDTEIGSLLTKFSNNVERAIGVAYLALSNDPIRMVKMMNSTGNITMEGLSESYAQRAQSHLA